jgi:hypothetical protein
MHCEWHKGGIQYCVKHREALMWRLRTASMRKLSCLPYGTDSPDSAYGLWMVEGILAAVEVEEFGALL